MKELFNYRYYVLLALVGLAMVAAFHPCTPGKDFGYWLQFHIATKLIALACMVVAYRAINYWLPKGRISALAKLTEYTSKIIEQ